MLGGYAAQAESAWMGAPPASEVLEPFRLPRGRGRHGGSPLARMIVRIVPERYNVAEPRADVRDFPIPRPFPSEEWGWGLGLPDTVWIMPVASAQAA